MCLICIDIYSSLTIRTILFKFPNAHLLKPRPYALNFCCSLLKLSSLKLTMKINLFPMSTKWGDVRYFAEIRVNKTIFYQIRSHGWWSRSLMEYLPKMINQIVIFCTKSLGKEVDF